MDLVTVSNHHVCFLLKSFHGRFSSSLPIEDYNFIQGKTDIQIDNLHSYLKYTNNDSQLPFMVCVYPLTKSVITFWNSAKRGTIWQCS